MTTHWDKVPEHQRKALRDRIAEVSADARRRAQEIRKKHWIVAVHVNSTTAICTQCKRGHTALLKRETLYRWLDGEPIDDTVPELTADEWTLLETGVCGTCTERRFS